MIAFVEDESNQYKLLFCYFVYQRNIFINNVINSELPFFMFGISNSQLMTLNIFSNMRKEKLVSNNYFNLS